MAVKHQAMGFVTPWARQPSGAESRLLLSGYAEQSVTSSCVFTLIFALPWEKQSLLQYPIVSLSHKQMFLFKPNRLRWLTVRHASQSQMLCHQFSEDGDDFNPHVASCYGW